MSAKARVWLLVGAIALAAAGATVGVTLLTRTTPPSPAAVLATPKGSPPLEIDLSLRTDPEAVALRRATSLYAHGKAKAAGVIFERYGSLEAQVGAALSGWPEGFDRLAAIARQHPGSALAQLELGLAFLWQNRFAQAEAAWRKARTLQPDTSYAVHAKDFLHPKDVPGLPYIILSFPLPASFSRAPTAELLASLAGRARAGSARDKLRYGLILWTLDHPISAERQFAAAAAQAPHDVDARVAEAVGLFDKDRPQLAFSRLGPLTKVFPRSVEVRFHLGLMLLWIHDVADGKKELQRVIHAGESGYAASARQLVKALGK